MQGTTARVMMIVGSNRIATLARNALGIQMIDSIWSIDAGWVDDASKFRN